jgi:para-nitrobenzyl esterase
MDDFPIERFPTVRISSGELRGTTDDGIDRYLGIPYAAAPTKANRFRLPVAHPDWPGVRNAMAHGATAPQAPYAPAAATLLPTVTIPGDDYLNLNIWAPADANGLPVMVWVHGGSLAHGSNALEAYDGSSFARDGIVFVSINYRLGSEGFSVLDGADLNPGLADVAAALRWVHREIAAFGGDPEQVTAFGQSAGSILLGTLLASPNRPPFARVILQSAVPAASSPRHAGRITRLEAKRLRIADTRDAFDTRSSGELVAAQQVVTAGSTPITGGPGFAIAIGDDLVPRDPLRAILAGAGDDVPVLIGSTTEEYRLWFVPTGLVNRISPWLFAAARLRFRISNRILRVYKGNRPQASRGELFGALATDLVLRLPLNRIADARLAAGASTHVYEFAWRSPAADLGAAHAVELGFVFDGVAKTDAVRLNGPDAPQQLADDMHTAWVAFAKTGDPGWRGWDRSRPVMVFDSPTSHVVEAPREDERAVWAPRG